MNTCCCEIKFVHYVIPDGTEMFPAIVISSCCDDSGAQTDVLNLGVFADDYKYLEEIKHCPNGSPNTWHLPTEMPEASKKVMEKKQDKKLESISEKDENE